jgi:hypothetical protein
MAAVQPEPWLHALITNNKNTTSSADMRLIPFECHTQLKEAINISASLIKKLTKYVKIKDLTST